MLKLYILTFSKQPIHVLNIKKACCHFIFRGLSEEEVSYIGFSFSGQISELS